MRAYIIGDMAGCCGIWRNRQCEVGSSEWRKARKQFTMDVNAAVEGLRRVGFPDIYVKDLHHQGNNIKSSMLLPGVVYEPGVHLKPIPFLGLLRWANCAVLLGFHARANSEEAFFPYTLHAQIEELKVNSMPIGEAHLIAGLLGEFGIPVNCISGDYATITQAKEAMPWLETLEIPKDRQSSLDQTTGSGTPLIRKRNELRAMVEKSCDPKFSAKKFLFSTPVNFEVSFRTSELADFYNSWGFHQKGNRISWTTKNILNGCEQLMNLLYVPRPLAPVANYFFGMSNFINRQYYRFF